MALRPIDIVLRALGVEQTEQKVGGAARGMAESVKGATGTMSREFGEAQKRVERLEAILKKRPGSLGIQQATQEARELRDGLMAAATQADKTNRALQQIKSPNLGTKLTGVNTLIENRQPGKYDAALGAARNTGAGMAAIGVGGIMASNALAKHAKDVEESENLVKESFGDSLSEIQAWSQGVQDTLGMTASEVRRNAATFNVMFDSMGIGKGEAVSMSKELTQLAYDMASFYNLSPDEAFEKLSAGITGEAEPLKRLGILINEQTIQQYAYANGIAVAGEALTEQQKVQARYGAIMEQTKKAQGDMARTADSATNIERRREAATERAMAAVGKGSAGAQVAIDQLAGKVVGLVTANESVAEGAGAFLTYGSYTATAVGGIVTFTAQVGLAKTGLDAMGISGVGAFTKIKAAALSTNVGFNLATLGVTAIGVAAAATVGYVAYAIGQHIGWLDKEQSYVDRLRTGWERLSAAISGTNLEWEKNEKDLAAEINKMKAANQKAVDDNQKTQAQADKDNVTGEIALRKKFAAEQRRIGDDANYVKNSEAVTRLQNQQVGITSSPTPIIAPSASTPALGVATITPVGGNAGSTPGSSLQPQIDALQDKIRATKDKTEKAELQKQMVSLRRAERDRKAAEKDAKVAQRLADKAADLQAGVDAMRAATEGDLDKMRADANAKIAQNKSKIQLDSQINRINELKDAGVLEDDAAQNQIERLKHAYAVRNAAMERDALMRTAQIESQAELAAAQAEASTQEAAQAKATMDKARIKANAILEKAKIAASVIGSDIAPLEDKKSKSAALFDFLKGGGSLVKPLGAGIGFRAGFGNASGAKAIGGGAFNPYASAKYEGTSGAFTSMIGWDGRSVFDSAYRNRDGSYRAPGRSNTPPRARGSVTGQTPDGSLIVQFEKLIIPNLFQDALEAVG